MTQAQVAERLTEFIKERFLDGDPASSLDQETPLLDWGIISSLNIAELISFIRDEFDYSVPQDSVNAQNFRNVGRLSEMISSTG